VGLQYGAGAPIPQLDPQLRHTDPRSKKVGERVILGSCSIRANRLVGSRKSPHAHRAGSDDTTRTCSAHLKCSCLSFCSAPTPRCHSLKDPIGTGRRQLILSAPGNLIVADHGTIRSPSATMTTRYRRVQEATGLWKFLKFSAPWVLFRCAELCGVHPGLRRVGSRAAHRASRTSLDRYRLPSLARNPSVGIRRECLAWLQYGITPFSRARLRTLAAHELTCVRPWRACAAA